MKRLVTLIFIIFATACTTYGFFDGKIPESMQKEVSECKSRMDLSDEQLTAIIENGDIKQLGCFYACLLRELGVLIDDEFDKKAIESTVKKLAIEKEPEELSKVIEAVENCAAEASLNKANDTCTKIGKYIECIYKFAAVDEEK